MSLFKNKPWGYELLFAHSEYYVGKILFIKKGHRLSRQYHEQKDETIFVLNGKLNLVLNKSEDLIILEQGDSYRINPLIIHRMEAKEGDVKLVEVSTPELNDIVRLEDDYGRV